MPWCEQRLLDPFLGSTQWWWRKPHPGIPDWKVCKAPPYKWAKKPHFLVEIEQRKPVGCVSLQVCGWLRGVGAVQCPACEELQVPSAGPGWGTDIPVPGQSCQQGWHQPPFKGLRPRHNLRCQQGQASDRLVLFAPSGPREAAGITECRLSRSSPFPQMPLLSPSWEHSEQKKLKIPLFVA